MYWEFYNIKYKKIKKGKLKKLEFKTNCLKFGKIGLKAIESGILNTRQLKAAKQIIARTIKKNGKIWVRVFPFLTISSKSIGAWMGKGKGQISHWGVRIAAGSIIFELCGNNKNNDFWALKNGGKKLSLKTKILH